MNYRKAKVDDYSSLALIHEEAFHGFFLTSLGLNFLKTYYKACLGDSTSIAVCAVDDNDTVKGFATGSLAASGYHRKLLINNFFSFSFCFIGLVFTKPKSIIRLAKNLNKAPQIKDDCNYSELLSIAVTPELKGSGVAKDLLELFEKEAVKMGGHKIALTTDIENNERVISFYKKNGYDIYYDFITYPNRRMYKMIKTIKH